MYVEFCVDNNFDLDFNCPRNARPAVDHAQILLGRTRDAARDRRAPPPTKRRRAQTSRQTNRAQPPAPLGNAQPGLFRQPQKLCEKVVTVISTVPLFFTQTTRKKNPRRLIPFRHLNPRYFAGRNFQAPPRRTGENYESKIICKVQSKIIRGTLLRHLVERGDAGHERLRDDFGQPGAVG